MTVVEMVAEEASAEEATQPTPVAEEPEPERRT